MIQNHEINENKMLKGQHFQKIKLYKIWLSSIVSKIKKLKNKI